MELLRSVTLGQFVPGASVIHRLDPRTRLGLLLLGMVVTFSCQHLAPLAALMLVTLVGARLAGFTLRYFVGGLRAILVLLVITFVFNLFFVSGGPVLVKAGKLVVTTDGLHFGLLVTARLTLLYLQTSLFTLTTSPIRLTDALESLFSPLRVVGLRTTELSMMVSIALRFIPTLVDTTEKIMKAQLSRGARFNEGSVLARTRAMVPVLVPLFVQAFQSADTLAEAMEARCYRGGQGRTRLVVLEAVMLDLLFVALAALATLGVTALDYLPWQGWL